jgi:hypothetical protein
MLCGDTQSEQGSKAMKRQFVHLLVPGQQLRDSLYDHEGRLLLEKGNTLSEEMTTSLLEGDKKFVFMGDWNATEFAQYVQAIPLSDYRDVARQL